MTAMLRAHHHHLPLLLLLGLLHPCSARPTETTETKTMEAALEELRLESQAMNKRLQAAEMELKTIKDTPKVAFAASLGGNGLMKTTFGNVNLVYRDVLTNVGGAYDAETGEFKAPVRGVYYVRFTANGPTNFPMSAVLYKNDRKIQLIAHEQPSGEGSDTASNGAALLLEQGDTLRMVLWHNTQIWDNSNHHSTFSGFLLFPLAPESVPPTTASQDGEIEAEARLDHF